MVQPRLTPIDPEALEKEFDLETAKAMEAVRKETKPRSRVSITPSRVHYVDVSVVTAESFLNIIGILLMSIGTVFIGAYYATPVASRPVAMYCNLIWLIFALGIVLIAVGKIYLFYRVSREKIPWEDFVREESEKN